MGDKAIIVLMLLFLVTGIVTYDHYVEQNGGISPVGQLIDFAGISKNKEAQKIKELEEFQKPIIEERKKMFSYRSGERLKRLAESHQALEIQRKKLIDNRQETLEILVELVKSTEQEFVKYTNLIKKEQELFRRQLPDFEQIKKDLLAVQQEKDVVLRQEKYQVVKEQLLSLLEEVMSNPTQNVSALGNLFLNLDKIINENKVPKTLMDDCSNVEHCFQKQVDGLEKNLTNVVSFIGDDVTELTELIEQLKGHYEDEALDINEQEQSLNDNQEQMDFKVKNMVEQLVQVTDNDLRDLIYLHQEMELEYEIMTDDMEEQQNQWQQRNQDMMIRMRNKIKDLQKSYKVDLRYLKEKNRVLAAQQKTFMRQVKENTEKMIEMVGQRFKSNQRFIGKMASMINIDMKRLVQDQQYALQKNETYRKDRKAMGEKILALNIININHADGGLGTKIKSELRPAQELRKTDSIRTLSRFGLK